MAKDQRVEHIAATIAVAELVRRHITWGDLIEVQKDEYRRLARECLRAIDGTTDWEWGFELRESDTGDVYDCEMGFESEQVAIQAGEKRVSDEDDDEYPPLTLGLIRRRKAGVWEVVAAVSEVAGTVPSHG